MSESGRVFTRGRLHKLALLSIPSGMPLGWVFNTFQYFLVDLGVSRAQIGFLSGVSLPWTLKFLWAPFIDHYAPAWPGRRRSWMLMMLVVLAAIFIGLGAFAVYALDLKVGATSVPLKIALIAGGFALAVAFISATFDIAYDAHAVEYMTPDEYSIAPGLRSAYYYVGVLAAGAFAISSADYFGWPLVFTAIGCAFFACIPIIFLTREPADVRRRQRTLRASIVEPFVEFFKRGDAWAIAGFLIFYKFGDNIAGTMVNPFLRDLCFTNREAGLAVKGVGLVATIVGGLVGGAVVLRLGLWRSLWILGLAQALANLLYAAAAADRSAPLSAAACATHLIPLESSTRLLAYASIGGEYFCKAMAATAQGALLLKVCDRANAMTQFAFLSSLFALGRWAAGLPSGWLVESLGYPMFFVICATVAAIPGFFFLVRLRGVAREAPQAS